MDANAVTIGSAAVLFLTLFGFWWKLDSKIEKVRDAFDTARPQINGKLGVIEKEQATHSERFATIDEKLSARLDCIDGKVDDLKQGS